MFNVDSSHKGIWGPQVRRWNYGWPGGVVSGDTIKGAHWFIYQIVDFVFKRVAR